MTGMLAPGLHLIELPLGTRRNTAYLIEGADSLLVFDTGTAGQLEQHLVPYLAEIGRSPDEIGTVVVSHCDIDHWGGAADIRRIAPGASILAHERDAALIGDTDRTVAERYQEFVAEHGIGWGREFLALQHDRAAPVTVDLLVDDGHLVDLGGRGSVVRTKAERWVEDGDRDAFDLVFVDPPYALTTSVVASLVAAVGQSFAEPDALFVVERATRDPFAWPDGFEPLRSKKYGETTLWFGRCGTVSA